MESMSEFMERMDLCQTTKKMSDETNNMNNVNMSKLLKHFHLDKESEAWARENIFKPVTHPYWTREFNSHNRLIMPVQPTAQTDEGYKRFVSFMELQDLRKLSIDDRKVLMSYETWGTGMFKGAKLFRWLLRNEIINQSYVEQLTSIRSADPSYIVVSKNALDWLVMSTNQSFSSCMGLESGHSEAVYMGIPQLWSDPHKFLVYMTPGKLRTFSIKGLEFKHFRYINRSVAVFTEDRYLQLIRYYPAQSVDFVPFLEKMAIKAANNRRAWQSHDWPQARQLEFKDDAGPCMGYNDHGVALNYQTGRHFYSPSGASGARMRIYWCRGFAAITNVEDFRKQKASCHCCDEYYPENELRWVFDERVCDECLDEYFVYCERCDEYHPRDNATYIDKYCMYVCDTCLEEDFFVCGYCSEPDYTHEAILTKGDDYICLSCYEEFYLTCEKCDAVVLREDTCGAVCNDCGQELEEEKSELEITISEATERIEEINELIMGEY